MSIQNLEHLFKPESVAVIGASNHKNRVSSVVIRNLLQGGFAGTIMPINPKHTAAQNLRMLRTMTSLGFSKQRTDDMKILQVTMDLSQ